MRSPPGSSDGALGTRRGPENNEKREERFERTRRTWMDMAAVKTFDLLVGVVLVLQCVRNVHAEIATSYGKNSQLQHRVRCAAAAGGRCGPAVTGGIRHDKSCKCVLILHIKPKHALVWMGLRI